MKKTVELCLLIGLRLPNSANLNTLKCNKLFVLSNNRRHDFRDCGNNVVGEQMLKKGFDRRKEDEMQKAFSEADKNKDGYLSLDEYMDVFHNHGVNISRDEVSDMCRRRCI